MTSSLKPSVLRSVTASASAAAVLCALAVSATPASAVGTAADLGAANSFAVLAGTGITNTGPTTLTGDIGTFPTPTITGVGLITVNGTNHGADAVTQQAKDDLVNAYNVLARQPVDATVSRDLGGQTLVPGVYFSASTMALTGELVLDGKGDPNAVFVFQVGSSLTTATASSVRLINSAQSCNVFWQLGASATLGTTSTLRGSVLALTSVTANTGAVVDGRLLARNGAVTLDTDTVTRPSCATVPPVVTPTPTPTAGTIPTTPTPTPTPTAGTIPTTPTPTPTAGTIPTTPTPSPVVGTPTPSVGVPGDATSRQITKVPTGGVATGDGSSAPAQSAWLLPGTMLAAAAVLVAGYTARRRQR